MAIKFVELTAGLRKVREKRRSGTLGADVQVRTCGWLGCSTAGEATLESRALCRNHFHQIAKQRLEECRLRVQVISPQDKDRIVVSQFLTQLISETTMLVSKAKFLSPWQRDQFFELSLAAAELFKRVQKNPRIVGNIPILIYKETDSLAEREITSTVDVSKRGACVVTTRSWERGERLWIEKTTNLQRTEARIAWIKTNPPSQTLIGLEILDREDFWG